jgi:hypothetical protein
MSDHLFAAPSAVKPKVPGAEKVYGRTYNGRYHMPRLPGDEPKKGHVPWQPGGVMRTTNLVGAFADTRALNIWEQEQVLLGLVRDFQLYVALRDIVREADVAGVNWLALRDHPDVRKALTGTPGEEDTCIVGRAKQAAGANEARDAGVAQHDVWERRAVDGLLSGTQSQQQQVIMLEKLLRDNHLERVPGLSERVIRNTEVDCAGRFDDVLRDTRTGELFMADLKTKRRKFFTWLEVDAQLAIYARADLMLTTPYDEQRRYAPGPCGQVNMTKGVVLHAPSDGGLLLGDPSPVLRTADLVSGWETALMARAIVDKRAYSKSAEREAFSIWAG